MNLDYQQPSFGNLPAGLQLEEPSAQENARRPFRERHLTRTDRHGRPHKTLTVHTIADLQMGEQLIQAKHAPVVEPPIVTDLQALREEEENTENPITTHAFSMTL